MIVTSGMVITGANTHTVPIAFHMEKNNTFINTATSAPSPTDIILSSPRFMHCAIYSEQHTKSMKDKMIMGNMAKPMVYFFL
jgi:hypothetical protein